MSVSVSSPDKTASERNRLWSLLGDLPADRSVPRAEVIEITDCDGYRLERLRLHLNDIEPVPALFIHPPGATGPRPTVLYNHSHGGYYDLGKNELIKGVPYQQQPPYAVELARHGISALSIDHWGFGERHTEGEVKIACDMLWRGQVMWGMMCYDSFRAIDYLKTRSDVSSQIGTIGMSMGSTMAWWMAALDPRIAVCVDLCCLTEFHTFIRTKTSHAPYYYVPGLLKHFTTAQINALIAPRPHLALAGIHDSLTPVEGLDIVDTAMKRVYADCGKPQFWRLDRHPVGHLETPEMRAAALDFLVEHLIG